MKSEKENFESIVGGKLSHPKIWNVKINKNRNHVCLSGFKISQGIKTFELY
jgi:hypothetical protein